MKKVLQVVGIGWIFAIIIIAALGAWEKEQVIEERDASYNELKQGWKVEVYHGPY